MTELAIVPEEWRDVLGFEGYYKVSSQGQIMSKRGRIRRLILKPQGYLRVSLTRPGFRREYAVHVLVAEAFIQRKPSGYQVNHQNAIKHDNRVSNLEWVTPKENAAHASAMGLLRVGQANGNARLSDSEATEIYRLAKQGTLSQSAIARRYGVSQRLVSAIKTGVTRTSLRRSE